MIKIFKKKYKFEVPICAFFENIDKKKSSIGYSISMVNVLVDV